MRLLKCAPILSLFTWVEVDDSECMCVLYIPVSHNSVLPEIQLWPQRSLVGANSAPGKQKDESLISCTTVTTCDDAVVLHLYLLPDLSSVGHALDKQTDNITLQSCIIKHDIKKRTIVLTHYK